MSNIKSLAEDLIQLTNKSHKLDEAIHLLKSTENTLAEDIIALRDGAKLECNVDIKKIRHLLEDIISSRHSASDELSNAFNHVEEAQSCIGYMEDEITSLEDYINELRWVKVEDKEE